MTTQITDLNITTSAAQFLAEKFTDAGWLVYWQATGVSSGTATVGEVTLVPEFPAEPNFLVAPKSPIQARTAQDVIIPAFAVTLVKEPKEEVRAGLGEDLFKQRAMLLVDGFASDKAEHFSFATLFRTWFREGFSLPILDFENYPTNPPLVDSGNADVWFENRELHTAELVDVPHHARYYLNMEIDLVFFD
ncbi:MAG: hypothetical protein KOO63_03880 [Bacteroidales bacterium]|nr:hypothetical protein [Candidatus Latescibacterota bacterium]